jgi:CBS domain-containing protein
MKGRDGLKVSGMVVLNKQGNIAGVLSIKDILRATIPFYLEPKFSKFSWDGMLEQVAKHVTCRRVMDFMSKDIVTISDDASLMACVDLLIKKYLQRLVVVDKDQRAVGIVTIGDVYNIISQIFIDEPECRI